MQKYKQTKNVHEIKASSAKMQIIYLKLKRMEEMLSKNDLLFFIYVFLLYIRSSSSDKIIFGKKTLLTWNFNVIDVVLVWSHNSILLSRLESMDFPKIFVENIRVCTLYICVHMSVNLCISDENIAFFAYIAAIRQTKVKFS